MLFDRVIEKVSEDEDTRFSSKTATMSQHMHHGSMFSTPSQSMSPEPYYKGVQKLDSLSHLTKSDNSLAQHSLFDINSRSQNKNSSSLSIPAFLDKSNPYSLYQTKDSLAKS